MNLYYISRGQILDATLQKLVLLALISTSKNVSKGTNQNLMRSLFSVIQDSFYMVNLLEKIYEAQFSLFTELFTLSRERTKYNLH
jgi:hypothetical protein